MSTHNICFHGEIRKILCGYPLLFVVMCADSKDQPALPQFELAFHHQLMQSFKTEKYIKVKKRS